MDEFCCLKQKEKKKNEEDNNYLEIRRQKITLFESIYGLNQYISHMNESRLKKKIFWHHPHPHKIGTKKKKKKENMRM